MSETIAWLLPSSGPDGKSSVLVGDGTGYLSRVVGGIEAEQLSYAAELIEEARRVLDGRKWTAGELQLLAVELTEALAEMHGIAAAARVHLPEPGVAGDS